MSEFIHVLVADDNPAVCDVIAEALQLEEDMEVVAKADSGVACLDAIRAQAPDVVILDLIMPELDGLGVLEELGRRPPDPAPRVIVLSALGQEGHIRRAKELGADYYMVKPFDTECLTQRVRLVARRVPAAPVASTGGAAVSAEAELASMLREAGMLPTTKGYGYIQEAVRAVLQADANRIPGTMQLYATIADNHGTTPASVERAIRHAIAGAARNTGRRPPTNSEFLHRVADRIRMNTRQREARAG